MSGLFGSATSGNILPRPTLSECESPSRDQMDAVEALVCGWTKDPEDRWTILSALCQPPRQDRYTEGGYRIYGRNSG